jgi:cytochrome P450
MAAMLFYLSRYPHAYASVMREVRSTFDSAAEIRAGPRLNSCKYLRACVDETLRISPSAGSALWREVLEGGLNVDGLILPAGCEVGVGIYSIHHNRAYYPHPFNYRPERWLPGEGDHVMQDELKAAHDAYSPFSVGPRACIGKSLALMELMLTMAHVLYAFDFKAANGHGTSVGYDAVAADDPALPHSQTTKHIDDEFQLRDHITASKEGPILRFRRRR